MHALLNTWSLDKSTNDEIRIEKKLFAKWNYVMAFFNFYIKYLIIKAASIFNWNFFPQSRFIFLLNFSKTFARPVKHFENVVSHFWKPFKNQHFTEKTLWRTFLKMKRPLSWSGLTKGYTRIRNEGFKSLEFSFIQKGNSTFNL